MFALLLLGLCLQLGADAPELTPKLILDHPGLSAGDYPQVQEDLLLALEANPESPHSLAAMIALRDLGELCPGGIQPERLTSLQPKLEDPLASLELRHLLAREIKRHMFREDFPNFTEDRYLDFLTNWAVAGPFGHLDSALPIDRKPDPSGPAYGLRPTYQAPWGETLTWNSFGRPTNLSFVQPANFIEGNAGCGYLLTQFQAEEKSATLELFCDENIDVFFNGNLLQQIRRYQSASHTVLFHLPIQLAEENVLLVRFAIEDAPSISARILGPKKALSVHESEWTHLSAHLEQEKQKKSKVEFDYPLPSATARKAESNWQLPLTDSIGEQLLQMNLFIHYGRSDRALMISEPESDQWLPVWLRLRHRALQRAPHLPREHSRRGQIQIEERLAQIGIPSPLIRASQILRLSSEDKSAEAVTKAEILASEFPSTPYFSYLKAQSFSRLDPSGLMARKSLLEHLSRFPHSSAAWKDLAGLAEQAGDPLQQLEYLRKALEFDGWRSNVVSDLLDTLLSGTAQHRKEARNILEKWQALFPKSAFSKRWKRRLLVERNLIDAIEEDLIGALEARPFQIQRHNNLIHFHLEHGDFDRALAAIQNLELMAPGREFFSTTTRVLGSIPLDEQFFGEFAPDRQAALEAAHLATDASTALVLDSGMYYFFEDGSSHRLTHTISKALDRKGTELLHEQAAAPGTRIARVLTQEGKTYEPVLVDEDWVMPSLNPGDLVEIQYETWHAGIRGAVPDPGLWRFASFQQPFVLSRYVVFLPNSLKGEWRKFQFEGSHEEIPWRNGTVHVFTQHLSPRYNEEPLRPSNDEVLPWVQYGEDFDQEEAIAVQRHRATWYEAVPADLKGEMLNVLSDLQPAAQSSHSQHLRAEAIYDWITQYVVDFSDRTNLPTVWHSKRGYPLGLMAAMLRLDGIPFEWAILHPTQPPILDTRVEGAFQSPADYGRLILRLEANDASEKPGWFLLPEAGRGYPFLSIPNDLAGCSVLVFGEQGTRKETLPSDGLQETWSTDLKIRFTLQTDRSAVTQGTMRVTDAQGSLLRERIHEAEPSQRSQIARQLLGGVIPGMNIQKWEFTDLEKRGAPFEIVFSGDIPGFVKGNQPQVGCRLRIQPMRMASSLGTAKREWPLVFRLINRTRWQVELDCNGLFDFEYGPESVSEIRDGYLYEFNVDKTDGILAVTRTVEIAGLWLEPEELSEFLDTARKNEQQEKRAVRLISR